MESRLRRQLLWRPHPICRNCQLRIGRWYRIGAGDLQLQRAFAGHDLQRYRLGRRRLQVVVDDRAVRRTLSRGRIRRQRGVAVAVPMNAQRGLGRKQKRPLSQHSLIQLAQRRDVVQNPETAPVRRHRKIVVLDQQVANRCRRHIEPQRLPVIAVVERDINRPLRSGKQQSNPSCVLAHRVHILIRRNAVGNFGPALPAVARAIDVRMEIIQPQRVDRRVCSLGVGVARLDHRDFLPR